jgi:predicted MFS family arabinose efflux permease
MNGNRGSQYFDLPFCNDNRTLKPSATRIFYILIISQFCGTSLWFAGNAILSQLQAEYGWQSSAVGNLTSAVQLGFIVGTFLFAVIGMADRFSPSKIFLVCSVLGALSNVACLFDLPSFGLMISSRFLTGFALAGIYPIGMKIAADWREQGLGHWLGALVGALVLGTSFPHALKLFGGFVNPQLLTIIISSIALTGGLMVWFFIPDGPYRKSAQRFSFANLGRIFQQADFRAAAFGYFGHMWELYAFWAFVPWLIITYNAQSGNDLSVPLWSFITIASGGLGCWLGGLLSQRTGSKPIAKLALICSGLCCLFSPFLFQVPQPVMFVFLIFWGFMVVADSPQFSALVAQHAPHQFRGSAITMTICIGFAITIASIQLLNFLQTRIPSSMLLILLLPGPIIGVFALLKR